MNSFLLKRLRRNRKSPSIRNLVRETHLHACDFIAPLFLIEGKGIRQPIHSFPHVFRLSIDEMLREAETLLKLGIPGVILFPYVDAGKRDLNGNEALQQEGLMQKGIRALKKELPELTLITDVALDPYTTHGHDGIMNAKGEIDNDATLEVLAKMALTQAQAGIDIVAPSDMMDGRIRYIRHALDQQGFTDVSIMSYAVKYASALYAPFREALGSAPRQGDKKTYQMDPANAREALLESQLDEEEGTDFLLVKPALFYLDIISKIRSSSNLPLAAYQVGGEYAMIHSAAERGWIDGTRVMMEALIAIKRAGADIIISYAAKEIVPLLSSYSF